MCRAAPGVRYIRLKQYTPTGTKLNIGIEAARGQFIQKIDDDDYYGPGFLENQVRHMPSRGFTLTLVTRCCFLILLKGDDCIRHSGHGWHAGGSFYFHRAMWKRNPFRAKQKSMDSWFIADNDPRLVQVCAADEYLVVRHGGNHWNAMTTGRVNEYFSKRTPHPRRLQDLVHDRAKAAQVHAAKIRVIEDQVVKPVGRFALLSGIIEIQHVVLKQGVGEVALRIEPVAAPAQVHVPREDGPFA